MILVVVLLTLKLLCCRELPSSFEFVSAVHGVFKYVNKTLEGYNKIAYNTLPNFIAFLIGMNVEQLVKVSHKAWNDEMDDCPFIWKNYSEEKFSTAYLEDSAPIGTFNYAKYGFLNSPTDYYARPIMKAALDFLPTKASV
ncbi:hypothetical protein V9T40_012926 [Parthenolecanium corni]|uniref:Uncharacterized protein n=1 Tax=Parthenolecanium corni TaxID=536013 RepID=A0AAN9TAG4_9HEMI